LLAKPPRDDDKFYLSTDERNTNSLTYLRTHNAILVSGLLTIKDRRLWVAVDVDGCAGVVEQAVLSKAYFFLCACVELVCGGGAVNMRAVDRLDPRTGVIDDTFTISSPVICQYCV